MNTPPGVHHEDGSLRPLRVGVRMRTTEDGPTARQLAAVYLYAQACAEAPPGNGPHTESLPVPPKEMAEALNAVIEGAGNQLVWVAPETEGADTEVRIPEDVPEYVARHMRKRIGHVIEALRAEGIDVEVGDTRVVDLARGGVIPHGPDGDAVPEQDASRVREEHDRYLRLAETVFRGLTAIYDATAGTGSVSEPVMRQVRVMAGAIGDGDLVRTVDEWLAAHDFQSGPRADERQEAERLAREILERQITLGQARVPWEARGSSREGRIKTAEVVLRASRVGAAVGYPVGAVEWVDGVTGALMAEAGHDPATASQVAKLAQAVLTYWSQVRTQAGPSEARSAAETS